jgi:hypothetical protein
MLMLPNTVSSGKLLLLVELPPETTPGKIRLSPGEGATPPCQLPGVIQLLSMPDVPVQVRLAAAQVKAVSKAQATAGHGDKHRINLPEAREGAMMRILVFILDFPDGFLPTTSVGLFSDSIPAPQICKPFFQSALGFSPAQGVFRCRFRLQCPVSPRCEDTASVVSGVSLYF